MAKFFVLWLIITTIGVIISLVTKQERREVVSLVRRVAVIAIPTAIVLAFVAFLEGAL